MTLNHTRLNVPHIHTTSTPESHISLHFYTTSHFRDTGNFKTSAPNDSKMTLNTTRSKVLHICVTSIPESQISVRFALREALFQISHILLFPIDYHVKRSKENRKKCQHFKFHNSFTSFGRDPPRSTHEFWGANLVYTFRADVV